MAYIPYGRQQISAADIDAVVEVLRSDWLTQGPVVGRFEAALATYAGAKHALAVNSATSALHLACVALALGPGDWLWTSSITFVASANCGRYCGANVDFVDIDPATYNMSIDALAIKLRQAERLGRLPKVVVPVHFGGRSCDMRAIWSMAQKYGFRVVEDAAHAIGGTHAGDTIGSCRYSDIAVFSFHPVKIVTTGEGGAVLTNDSSLAARIDRLRSHGTTRDPSLMEGASDGLWYYQMLELGWNYRLTDIQAALGLSQIRRIDAFVEHRTRLAERYDRKLANSGLGLPSSDVDGSSAWHLYAVQWNEMLSRHSRAQAFARLREADIGVNVHYIPVHLQPYYRRLGFRPGDFPHAEEFYAKAITLPLHAGLKDEEQDRVVDCLLALR